jgi:hypothetical protein
MMAKKAKPKTKTKKTQEPSQKERFVAAARSVGAAESADAFDRAFRKVVRPAKAERSR